MQINKQTAAILALCAFNIALSIALGAYSAHGLKDVLSTYKHGVFDRALEYLFHQSLGVMLLMLVNNFANVRLKSYIPIILLTGTYVFCISTACTAFSELNGWNGLVKAGAIAPFGGVLMILSWLLAFWFFLKHALSK